MNRWVSEGNCLLKRKEDRFDIKKTDLNKAIKKIIQTGNYTKEKFLNNEQATWIENTIYDIPEATNMKTFTRKNYTGARLRTYKSLKGRKSFLWGEWKTKHNKKVTKTRECLRKKKAISLFFWRVKKEGLVFVMTITYRRRAVNSKDGLVRITFDDEIKYFNTKNQDITKERGLRKGCVKVKVKYAGKKPQNVFKILEGFIVRDDFCCESYPFCDCVSRVRYA